MLDTIPTWCKPVSLDMWQTRLLEDAALRCSLPIHEDWSRQAKELVTPMDVEHQYSGRNAAERLIINMMADADPESDMTNWVTAIMKLVGFPILALGLNHENPPHLLEWQAVAVSDALLGQYAVDELHLFEGLARIPDLTRLYMLLARRDSIAWKITLTLNSALLPDSDSAMIASNDHARAGATFGNLHFL
ncbi:MAG: hypothetical protein Q9P01_01435 [Anaerolineae bacterium]|nr:hypothetical protein [Anaerolineae bacterium]MDQ7033525.1 hypothetical protein [Anaerolineae bacterium]